MEEGRAKAVAGSIAVVAILALGALSLRAQDGIRGRLQVLEQYNGADSGPQKGMPPGVYLRLETPKSDSTRNFVETHVVDANGIEYPIQSWTYRGRDYSWVPLGYKRSPRSPEAVANVMAYENASPSENLKQSPAKNFSVPVKLRELDRILLRDFPAPEESPLPLSKDAPFVLRRVDGAVRVEPIPGKMPDGDWELGVLATPYAPMLSFPLNDIGPGKGRSPTADFTDDVCFWYARSGSPYLSLPYPQDTDAVKLRLRVDRHSDRVETIRIPGIRLVRKRGETVFELSAPFLRIPTRSGGNVVASAPPPQRRESKIDHRTPILSVNFEPDRRAGGAGVPLIELIGPKPEELGLRTMTLGRAVSARWAPSGPVWDQPFAATIRLTWTTYRTDGIGVYTVPIR